MKTRDMTYIGVSAVLIAVCSWISIPTAIPFTLQTFAVFLVTGIFGGRRGAMAVLLYLLLGAVGLPVFAGFTGGIGILFQNTGGYLIGFLFTALLIWGCESLFGKKLSVFLFSSVLGLAVCYLFGTIWFMALYMQTTGPVGVAAVLGWCVIPFIIPDLAKIALAATVSRRIVKAMGKELLWKSAR